MKNSTDNVFDGVPVRPEEAALVEAFFAAHDLAPESQRALANDLGKFVRWYVTANNEPFSSVRIATVDVSSFRDFLRREKGQAVSTVNRALCSVRKYLSWLAQHGHIPGNPAKQVKELRRQQLAPKGLDRSQVRRLLREVELRGDVRAEAIFSLFLYTGCRVSDLTQLELCDLMIGERSGQVVFRFGKGGKQRSVPLPLPARQTMQTYMESRPPVHCPKVFWGERGSLTERGVRALCAKYAAIVGFHIHPHLLRHTMAHQFLADTGNDLVSLAQILGHANLNTTAIYTRRTEAALEEASDRLTY